MPNAAARCSGVNFSRPTPELRPRYSATRPRDKRVATSESDPEQASAVGTSPLTRSVGPTSSLLPPRLAGGAVQCVAELSPRRR